MLPGKVAPALNQNGRSETPLDVVSRDWNDELADTYTGISNAVGIELDLEAVRQQRPQIAKLLREARQQPE